MLFGTNSGGDDGGVGDSDGGSVRGGRRRPGCLHAVTKDRNKWWPKSA